MPKMARKPTDCEAPEVKKQAAPVKIEVELWNVRTLGQIRSNIMVLMVFGGLSVQTCTRLQALREPALVLFFLMAMVLASQVTMYCRRPTEDRQVKELSARMVLQNQVVRTVAYAVCIHYHSAGPFLMILGMVILPASTARDSSKFKNFLVYIAVHFSMTCYWFFMDGLDLQFFLALIVYYPIMIDTAYRRSTDLDFCDAMSTSAAIMKTILSSLSDGCVLLDQDMHLLAADARAHSMLGLSSRWSDEEFIFSSMLRDKSPLKPGITNAILDSPCGSFPVDMYTMKVCYYPKALDILFNQSSGRKAIGDAQEVYVTIFRIADIINKPSDQPYKDRRSSMERGVLSVPDLTEPLLASDRGADRMSSAGSEFSLRSVRSFKQSSAVASVISTSMPLQSWVQHGSVAMKNGRDEMEDRTKVVLGQGIVAGSREDVESEAGWSLPGGFQDATLPSRFSFFGVFDGHGGARAASMAKSHIIAHLASTLELNKDPEAVLCQAILETEDHFLKLAMQNDWVDGATLAVVLLDTQTKRIISANVGDTEVLLGRIDSNGELAGYQMLSELHQPDIEKNHNEYNRVKEAGGIVRAGRVGHPLYNPKLFSLAVSRSIGDPFYKLPKFLEDNVSGVTCEPYSTSVDIGTGRGVQCFVVLASDGLWSTVSYENVASLVAKRINSGQGPDSISRALSELAVRQGSLDNITVQLLVTERS